MLKHLSDYMASAKCELKLISKHASMVTTQVEQVLKAQNDLLNELNSMLANENSWTLPEPTPKKRGVLFLSPEDMQEAKKSMKEKGIKS